MLISSLGLQPTHPTHPDDHLPLAQSNDETLPDQLLPPSPGVRPGEELSSFSDNFEKLMVDKLGGPYRASDATIPSHLSYLSTPPIDQTCSGLPRLAPSLNGATTEGAFASETWVNFVACQIQTS